MQGRILEWTGEPGHLGFKKVLQWNQSSFATPNSNLHTRVVETDLAA